MEERTGQLIEALLSVDKNRCAELLSENHRADKRFSSLENLIGDALERIGEMWEDGSASLAQVYMSGIICEELFEQYVDDGVNEWKPQAKTAIAVLHDHHLLGKRIVLAIARSHGYEVVDFGGGLSCEQAAQLTIEQGIEVLLISTLMLHATLKVKLLKEMLRAEGCRTKIIVGGAPFRQDAELWRHVGADGFCRNALEVLQYIEKEGPENG